MKKVLFATTALVASAGIASAQGVELSGSAEMGIYGGTGLETQFWTDIDVKFTLSGETDNGLSFGATIDLDEEGGFAATNGGPESVFISGDFGKLTMGDTDGAFDWALQEVGIGSAIADDHTTHAGFSGNSGLDGSYDGQIARYEYSFGDFAFAVSAELDDTGAGDPVFGLGGKYSGDLGGVTLGVGLGYQTNGTRDIYGLSIDAKFAGGFRGIINYSDLDTDTHMGIGVGYSANGLTVSANYGEFDSGASGWGLAANYDLGGGAVLQAGYGSSDPAGTNTFSLGVAMSF
ncbi:MAG: porin [Brevirhabdus sp.]